jgi:hypothetical protein
MANAVQAVQRFGPGTFNVSPAATGVNAVDGGRLVEFDGANPGTIKLAVVDSTKWLGVALQLALPANSQSLSLPSGYPAVVFEDIPSEVGVAWTGVFKLTATAAALAEGDIVYCGAGGLIQKATTTGRPVGQVVQVGGIAASGSGLVRLF